MQLTLLTADLMLASAAQGAADRSGVEMKVFGDPAAVLGVQAVNAAQLVALDLRTPGLNVGDFMAELRSAGEPPIHVIAAAPHVHEASLAEARRAGCDEVVSRGEFERRLAATLERLSSDAG